MKELSESNTKKIIFEILHNVELFDNSEKDPANGYPLSPVPTPNGEDTYNKVKNGQLIVGAKIKQKENYMTTKTITYKNDISNLLKYYNECIKKLGGEPSSAVYNENANYAVYGNLV